ncbi:MAG TPA: ribonuclease III [Phototrophicaceae bacterium]|nr:ribonuclease III [Phototrophicaceae bacterium]
MTAVETVQGEIGVRFGNQDLLQQALTHRSYINEHGEAEGDNERLEFLGDAVLDFLVGDSLYQHFPQMPEGQLTRLRAALVRTESLAQLAQEIQIGECLRMGRGEEASGGRERVNNLCGAFEAVTGALYLDQGLEAVRAFILPRLEALIEQVLEEAIDKDARSRLQEWSQAELNRTPVYRTVSATGPDHQKEFVVEVLIADKVAGTGTGRSKQIAAQSAARDALKLIEKGELTV